MKFYITGSSGFIGTNLVSKLLDLSYTVRLVDIASPRIESHRPFWKRIDILDETELCLDVLSFKPDVFIHLAARTDLDTDLSTDYSVNDIGTANIVNIINVSKNIISFYFASSMLVCRLGYIPKSYDEFNPDTPYGLSKVNAELVIRKNLRSDCLFTIFRPTSLWGPWFSSPYGDFFNLVLNNFYIHPYKKNLRRNYGFILNCIDKLIFAIENKISFNNNYFYLCDYEPINTYEWAKTISQIHFNRNIKSLNHKIFYPVAKVCDLFNKIGLNFPFSSRRYSNMTTSAVFPTDDLKQLLCPEKYDLREAVEITLKWLKL